MQMESLYYKKSPKKEAEGHGNQGKALLQEGLYLFIIASHITAHYPKNYVTQKEPIKIAPRLQMHNVPGVKKAHPKICPT